MWPRGYPKRVETLAVELVLIWRLSSRPRRKGSFAPKD